MLTMKQRQSCRLKTRDKCKYTQLSGKYSDDSGEEVELPVSKKQFREVPTIEKPVDEGDTLQAISIRYHCSIAELKRINNIHKENEIFARPTIKVPIKPISIALAGVHTSGSNSPKELNGMASTVDIATLQDKLAVKFFNSSDTSKQNAEEEVKQLIFNSNIKSSERVTDSVSENVSVLNEEVILLPKKSDLVDPIYNGFSCSGVDGDISLKALIIIFVILIVVAPLIYVFYIAEHPEEYLHEHSEHVHSR